jgi:hypothetical protein
MTSRKTGTGTERIALTEALERHRLPDGATVARYESLRKQAGHGGVVYIGSKRVAVVKERGRWLVNAGAFADGVASVAKEQDAERRAIKQADVDYDSRNLNPKGARLSWGSYYVSGAFHFVSSDYQRVRKRSDGGWICNGCWEPASLEHNNPECHRCSDWSPCGTDCTLSHVSCKDCGTSLSVG